MDILVTGGAGFVGSNLALKLESQGHTVSVIDDFRTGRHDFLSEFSGKIYDIDLNGDVKNLERIFKPFDEVYHLAANADVRNGWQHERLDFEQNTLVTLNLLELCKKFKVQEFIFTSTGSIYGEAKRFPTPEDSEIPTQTSLYAASKFSSEAFIQAYASAGHIKATIFRLVSILGPRYTHGHIVDFVSQLELNPALLTVLGNGFQSKSYLHIDDCLRGLTELRSNSQVEVFNLGHPESMTVRESVSYICETLSLNPKIEYGTENRGWIGDNPRIELSISKANKFGWNPQITLRESVISTVEWLSLQKNQN